MLVGSSRETAAQLSHLSVDDAMVTTSDRQRRRCPHNNQYKCNINVYCLFHRETNSLREPLRSSIRTRIASVYFLPCLQQEKLLNLYAYECASPAFMSLHIMIIAKSSAPKKCSSNLACHQKVSLADKHMTKFFFPRNYVDFWWMPELSTNELLL